MKTSITEKEFRRLQSLKACVDTLWKSMENLVDRARAVLGEDGENPNDASADLILNSNDMPVEKWLKRNKIEVK